MKQDPLIGEAMRTGKISDEGVLYMQQVMQGFAVLTTLFLFLYAFVFYLLALQFLCFWF